jgi:hypothetical protein
MTNVVAAFQMSLDGYMQGAGGEVDWVGSWADALDRIHSHPGQSGTVILTYRP